MRLNKEQEKAASFIEGICAVIAVPGSGKTRVLIERIIRLIEVHGVPEESILAMAFNRNAAEEMKQRLLSTLGAKASRVTLSTIHSFCHYLLRSEGRIFEILSGRDQLVFIRNVMKELKVKNLSVGMIMREISLAKNNLISVEEFKTLFTEDKTMLKIADVYDLYDREKARKFLMDFDDLLVDTCRLLHDNPSIKSKYTDRYLHLLIDEYQDTNPVQVEILKTLTEGASHGSSFYITGDDAQSIYAFTGASVGNILNFERMFGDAKIFILSRNYRSTPQILRACQNLINHNERKIEKILTTKNPDGEEVIVLEGSSEEGEALNLVNEIQELVWNKGFQYKDIAVLYRCRFQSLRLEEAFSRHKIPYSIDSGRCFFNLPEIKKLLDYLRVISDPNSDAGDEALLSILNVPVRYIGRKVISQLEEEAASKGVHLYEALKSFRPDTPFIRKNVRELVSFLDPLTQLAHTLHPAEVINLLRNSLDYDRYVTDEDIPTPDDSKIQNLNQLQLAATRFSSIKAFIEYTETFQDETTNDEEGVSLMTIHKAKGLEFPVVFVVGLVEGILPSKKGDIEEERRICFVAMSRAMKLLFLSWSHTYLSQPSRKSLFLDEAMGVKQDP